MSVDEAKRVTVSFERSAFVPPPRTIADITAILDEERRDDLARALEAAARADQAAPDTADRDTLVTFYFRRVTALLDRLLHHAHVLTGGPRSWRTRLHGERGASGA